MPLTGFQALIFPKLPFWLFFATGPQSTAGNLEAGKESGNVRLGYLKLTQRGRIMQNFAIGIGFPQYWNRIFAITFGCTVSIMARMKHFFHVEAIGTETSPFSCPTSNLPHPKVYIVARNTHIQLLLYATLTIVNCCFVNTKVPIYSFAAVNFFEVNHHGLLVRQWNLRRPNFPKPAISFDILWESSSLLLKQPT